MKRENGFYWVIYGKGRHKTWEVARFNGLFWFFTESTKAIEEIDLQEIFEERVLNPEAE